MDTKLQHTNKCLYCNKKITAFKDSDKDWINRQYHRKCYFDKDYENITFSTKNNKILNNMINKETYNYLNDIEQQLINAGLGHMLKK